MAALDDPKTLGRARLSFADEADIDEFVSNARRASSAARSAPDQWRAFRLVRGTYGQRQADDAQMLRVKIPQGILDADAARRARRRRRAVLARVRPHHDAAEHPAPLREAPRRRARDAAPRRRRPHDARGLRQLGAQHHRLPVCGRGRRRGVRRHAVRRGADALPPAAPAELVAAAQVQDRVRGLRATTTRSTAINDIGWRARRAIVDGVGRRGFRVTSAAARRSCPTSGDVLYEFLPAGEMLDVAEAILRVFHRLGDYKHKQRNRMKFLIKSLGWDALAGRVRAARWPTCAPRAACRLPFDPERPPVETAPDWIAPGAAVRRRGRGARRVGAEVRGPGIVPAASSRPSPVSSAGLRSTGGAPTSGRRSRRATRSSTRHRAARRPHRRAAARARRPRARLRRRHACA